MGRRYAEADLALARELRDLRSISTTIAGLGVLAANQAQHLAARAYFQEALAIARELRSRARIGDILLDQGNLARLEADVKQSRSRLQDALSIGGDIGSRRLIGWSLGCLAILAWTERDNERVRMLLREGLHLMREVHGRGVAYFLSFYGVQAVRDGAVRLGIWLLGAAQAHGQPGIRHTPEDRQARDGSITAARAILGEVDFATAWAEGKAMTLERAMACALEVSDAQGRIPNQSLG